ncbi:MAG: hypothetical protein CSB44_01745 [Gammaproteobacteria bacterium]|nr:MAG: hypothetical protein CSB44_01745 [Gammaproteobacteria bacterium]
MTDSMQFSRHEAALNGLVRMVVELAILFSVYFFLAGSSSNPDSSAVFFTVFYLVAIVYVPAGVFLEYEGKVLDRKPTAVPATSDVQFAMPNPWTQTLPCVMPFAVAGAPLIFLFMSNMRESLLTALIGCVLVTALVVMAVVWMTFDRFLKRVVRASSSERSSDGTTTLLPGSVAPLDNDSYYVMRHFLPWAVVVSLVGFLMVDKHVRESIFDTGGVEALSAAFSLGSTCFVLCIWCWYESAEQMKNDMRHGIVQEDSDHELSSGDLFFLFSLVGGLVVAGAATLSWLLPGVFSTAFAWQVLGVLLCVCSGVAGNILGIVWSSRRE